MKRLTQTLILTTLVLFYLSSCKTYRYYPPTANTALFSNKNELHIAGEISTSGATAKAAYSITDHIGIMGMYNSDYYKYRSKEGEAAIGWYGSNANARCFYLSGGMGFGSNFAYTDSTYKIKDYEGSFYRPFVQINYGYNGKTIIGKLKGDMVTCLKGSYFLYDGKHLSNGTNDPIRSEYFVIEPTWKMGIGSRVFHFEITFGMPLHPTFEGLSSYSNARTFPFNAGFGLRFVFGRDKSE